MDRDPMQFPCGSNCSPGQQQTPSKVWSSIDSEFGHGAEEEERVSAQPGHVNNLREVDVSSGNDNSESASQASSSLHAHPCNMPESPQPKTMTVPTQMCLDKSPGQGPLEGPRQKAGIDPEPITTLMIRNLPRTLSQAELLAELELAGFAELYDFCYMPRCFQSGENKGFAFVNFTHAAAAGCLVGAWHHQRLFGLDPSEPALNISSAVLQGFDANVAKVCGPRSRRIRNPDFVPFFVRDVSMLYGNALVETAKLVASVTSQEEHLVQATISTSHGRQQQWQQQWQRQQQQKRMPLRTTPAGERLPMPSPERHTQGRRPQYINL